MKALLVAESRAGQLLGSTYELISFAEQLGCDSAMFLVGKDNLLPHYPGTLYLADSDKCQEFSPSVHKNLLLDAVEREQADLVVFSHSSYGWDLAPRVALALEAAQISEVVDIVDGVPVVPVCNAKLRRKVKAKSAKTVLTLQPGAFNPSVEPSGNPTVIELSNNALAQVDFNGYEEAETGGVDLSKAEIIVSAGRGIGKSENLDMIAQLARALGGEYGASRPVVDAEWAEHTRQIGTTGQTVSPKLYVACGISGAIQHLAGMQKAEFIVAVNTDKDAPIGDVADVLAVADLKQLVPALTERLS